MKGNNKSLFPQDALLNDDGFKGMNPWLGKTELKQHIIS